ncbi:MAG: RNA polymerase sigma factor, partial [Gemmataceae bacterium]
HDRALFTFLCRQIEQDFTPASWEQFRRHAIQGEPAASVAAACGTTPAGVMKAKARILARLRAEAGPLAD